MSGIVSYVGGVELVRASHLAELHVRRRITVRAAYERRGQVLISCDVPQLVDPRRHYAPTTNKTKLDIGS